MADADPADIRALINSVVSEDSATELEIGVGARRIATIVTATFDGLIATGMDRNVAVVLTRDLLLGLYHRGPHKTDG